jgi:poly(A) polymerase
VLDVAKRVAQSGLIVPGEITQAARTVAPELIQLSPVKVRLAIEEVLLSPRAPLGLQWMQESGVIAALIPELDATVNFSQEAGRRHKDVWEHTKVVVMQSPTNPIIRWAALLHDVGKVGTRVLLPDGRVTFHRHAELGAKLFGPIARRLGFTREERQHIRSLILHHLRANAYDSSWTDGAVRRFDHEMGDLLLDLIELSRADVTSVRPGRREEASRNIDALMQRIMAVRALDARIPPLPPGLGNAIMEAFSLGPSRRVGELRKLCEDAIVNGTLMERQPAEYYVNYLHSLGIVGSSRL